MNLRSTGQVLATGAIFTLREVSEGAKNDPALAMRIAATQISDTLLNKVNTPIKDSFEATVVPVVRGGILALDAVRMVQTLRDPESTGLDKVMDVGRVASDLVGFAGGVAVLTMPQYATLGRNLMGFSYAVDAVSHAYRGLNHASKRINVWNKMLEEQKQADKSKQGEKPQEPAVPPVPPQEPAKPADPNQVQITIKGSVSAAAAILNGSNSIAGTVEGPKLVAAR